MEGNIKSYKDLVVWQKSMLLTEKIYELSSLFPVEEKFGLASQMRRSAVSIPSNIAEGRGRSTRKDFAQFLHIALGSASELETQVELARRLSLAKKGEYTVIVSLLIEVKKMLASMLSSLKA